MEMHQVPFGEEASRSRHPAGKARRDQARDQLRALMWERYGATCDELVLAAEARTHAAESREQGLRRVLELVAIECHDWSGRLDPGGFARSGLAHLAGEIRSLLAGDLDSLSTAFRKAVGG